MSKPRKPFTQMSFLDPVVTSAPASLSPDIQAGKTWWNNLKPRERKERLNTLRLRGVLSASAADAWAEEKCSRSQENSQNQTSHPGGYTTKFGTFTRGLHH